jgi:cystathionine beta-lyase
MSRITRQPITRLIHHPYHPPEPFVAPQPPIHKASTIIFKSAQDLRTSDWKEKNSYTYGLHGTPTTFLLEERLCELEGGSQCLLVPSGLSAIALVNLSLLQSGDEVLIPDNCYGPSKALAEGELKAWGISHQIYNPMDPADLMQRIHSKTRMVWLEAAGSVTLEFPDLHQLVQICRLAGVITALDNTWGAGLAFHPFELKPGLGVDITTHALTKYPSGGADVLMGSVITRELELHLKLKLCHMRLGLGVGANDVEAVLRSLPSIEMRYREQDKTARTLAVWAQSRAEVVQVLHPALPGSPGHEHWASCCAADAPSAAGLFSLVLAPQLSQDQVDAFCNALNLFKIGYSWGGPISLVVPYQLRTMRVAWPAHIQAGHLVRFSTGFEHVDDLRSDLDQAFNAALGSVIA